MLTTVLLFLTVQVSGVSNEVLFVDKFDNEKLPGWAVSDPIPPGDVKVKDGKLILGNRADLTIDVRKSDTWMDYTTTLQLRFLEIQQGGSFRILVRHSLGPFNVWTNQQFEFLPHEGKIQVYRRNNRVVVKRLGFVKRLGPSGTTLTTWAAIKNARLEER